MSRFCQLAEFINHPQNKPYIAEFQRYVLILHDPKDEAFQNYLKGKFFAYSQLTGNQLLFFAFCKPEDHTSRYRRYEDAIRGEVEFGSSDSLFAEMTYVCRMIGTEMKFPLLAVSSDLNSTGLQLLSTNADCLREQFLQLSSGVSAEDVAVLSSQKYQSCQLSMPLAQMLALAFAPSEAYGRNDNLMTAKKDAWNLIDNHTKALRTAVDVSRQLVCEESEKESIIEQAQNDLMDYESLIRFARTADDNSSSCCVSETYDMRRMSILDDVCDSPTCDSGFIQADSASFFSFICAPNSKSNSRTNNYNHYLLSDSSYPLLPYLPTSCRSLLYEYNDYWKRHAKSSEKWEVRFDEQANRLYRIVSEIISQSLIQRLRWSFGINMGDYFLLYKDGAKAYIKTANQDILLNMKNKKYPDRYQAPCLGQCLAAFREIDASPNLNPFVHEAYRFLYNTPAFDETFCEDLAVINMDRNCVEHGTDNLSEEDFRNVFDAFVNLYDSYFDELLAIIDANQRGVLKLAI